MTEELLQLGLSISVICNGVSIFKLIKALKEKHDLDSRLYYLESRVHNMECQRYADVWMDSGLRSFTDESRIQGMAEDTKMAE
jgi:hypothetical protein